MSLLLELHGIRAGGGHHELDVESYQGSTIEIREQLKRLEDGGPEYGEEGLPTWSSNFLLSSVRTRKRVGF